MKPIRNILFALLCFLPFTLFAQKDTTLKYKHSETDSVKTSGRKTISYSGGKIKEVRKEGFLINDEVEISYGENGYPAITTKHRKCSDRVAIIYHYPIHRKKVVTKESGR